MRYYLEPLGCVKNQVDAETMMGTLDKSGWTAVEDAENADLIIVNSCGFIDQAKQESINAVLDYKGEYPDKKILLAGCLVQRYARDLACSLPEADFFFGNRDLSRIAEAAAAAMAEVKAETVMAAPMASYRRLLLPLPEEGEQTPAPSPLPGERPLLSFPGSAYVKIAEGCDNHCSFCAVPLIRGPLRSRSVEEILVECRRLLDRGVRELCIIGQDLGAYCSGGRGLPELLTALSRLEGRFWVRLLYIHPDHFPRAFLGLLREDPRFLPYFDLPFQHGSEDILRAMNRRASPEKNLDLIAEIREALPDAVIRSTFLTGFPGETEEDFRKLLDFQEQARLDWAGVFTYSREQGTPAYFMKGQVPARIARERKARIEDRQVPITEARMDRFIGRELEALVEEAIPAPLEGEGEEGTLYLGRLFCHAPEVDGAAVISAPSLSPGDMVRCRVFARAGFDLEAVPIAPERGGP